MKLKTYNEADIEAVRFVNKQDKAFYAVEVQLTEKEGDAPIYYRANKLISGKNFRNVGRLILKAAGYDVEDNYSDFRAYAPMCGNFIDGTKKEALDALRRTWECWNGSKPNIQIVEI